MKISRRNFSKGCAAVFGATLVPAWAFAEEQALDGTLPVEISSPGRYVLNSNQSVNLQSTPAILVSCNDVEIDLQGFRIENFCGADTASVGVAARNRSRIHVSNGELRGFYAAVLLDDTEDGTHGHRVQNVAASNCTAIGFMISGHGAVLAQNVIENTGGTTLLAPCQGSMGIAVLRGRGCLIIGNNLSFDESGRVGIYVNSLVHDAVVLDNTIAGADHGIIFGMHTNGDYRDNTVTGASSRPYAGGRDIGHNL